MYWWAGLGGSRGCGVVVVGAFVNGVVFGYGVGIGIVGVVADGGGLVDFVVRKVSITIFYCC